MNRGEHHVAHSNPRINRISSYGNENWEFDEQGLMRLRFTSISDLSIAETDRKYFWPQGQRPDDHPSLNELGL